MSGPFPVQLKFDLLKLGNVPPFSQSIDLGSMSSFQETVVTLKHDTPIVIPMTSATGLERKIVILRPLSSSEELKGGNITFGPGTTKADAKYSIVLSQAYYHGMVELLLKTSPSLVFLYDKTDTSTTSPKKGDGPLAVDVHVIVGYEPASTPPTPTPTPPK